jgi:hypothetical protein
MEIALKKTLGVIIGGIDARVVRGCRRKKSRRHDAGVHARNGQSGEGSSIVVVGKEPAAGRMATKDEGGGCILADDRAIAKVGNHTKVFNNGHPKHGVDRHVVATAKRDAERTATVIDAGRFAANDGSELAVHRFVAIIWVPDSTTEFNGLERVSVVETLEASHSLRVLAHDPKMARQIARIQSCTGIKENTEGGGSGQSKIEWATRRRRRSGGTVWRREIHGAGFDDDRIAGVD